MAEISNDYLEIYAELPLRAGVVHIMAMARELLTARARIAELEQVTQYATERAVAAESKLDTEREEYSGWRPPVRVITSAEELDALPDRTIIRSGYDTAAQKSEDVWEFPNEVGQFTSEAVDLPATVLWQPEVNS